eukprot:scaffold45955_cov21-Tisochrysis_lutea.AAC.1
MPQCLNPSLLTQLMTSMPSPARGQLQEGAEHVGADNRHMVKLGLRPDVDHCLQGYMLELPGAAQCLHAIASLARSQGVQVALTAGDPGVVERHRSTMQNLMSR